jgi:hypothetical protein
MFHHLLEMDANLTLFLVTKGTKKNTTRGKHKTRHSVPVIEIIALFREGPVMPGIKPEGNFCSGCSNRSCV